MAYEPKTWECGEVVTDSDLNRIEQGIADAGSVMIVTSHYVNGVVTLDATIQELYDAIEAGIPVHYEFHYGEWTGTYSENSLGQMVGVFKYGNPAIYRVGFFRQTGSLSLDGSNYLPWPGVMWFGATSATDYPTYLTAHNLAFD